MIYCQLAICVFLWVQSLNISPHCLQYVPEIISELLYRNASTLPHCLYK